MAQDGLSKKEKALLDAARREVAVRKGPRVAPAAAALPAGLATTPLDQPTVLGWNHPDALQDAPKVRVAPDKWDQVAALMEAERRTEAERRARMRRIAMYVMLGVAVAALVFVLAVLRR